MVLHTDHHSLSHLLTQKDLSSRQARFFDFFADFEFEIKYIGDLKTMRMRCRESVMGRLYVM